MNVFQFPNYRSFLQSRLKNAGRGSLARIAAALRVHPSLITKALKGKHDFTPDQAFLLAEFLELNGPEKEFFLALVDFERAGNSRHRAWLKKRLADLRAEAQRAEEPRSEPTSPLSDRNQFIFYSHWYYSAIRLLTGVSGAQTVDAISRRLELPEALVTDVAAFLVATGLCKQADGQLSLGLRDTRIDASSPMIDRHLSNWRMKGLEKIPRSSPEKGDLFYSGPMAIHPEMKPRVRALIVALIEEVSRARQENLPEELVCLNIDWFGVS